MKISYPPGQAKWKKLLGSLDNEQSVPAKTALGIIKYILEVNPQDETIVRNAGDNIIVEAATGKRVKVVRRYF